MKKTIIIALIAVVIGVIFVSIFTMSQNDDFEEKLGDGDEQAAEPQGRNLSINLDEKMGLSAP